MNRWLAVRGEVDAPKRLPESCTLRENVRVPGLDFDGRDQVLFVRPLSPLIDCEMLSTYFNWTIATKAGEKSGRETSLGG